jgi:hypothetical protein
MNIQTIRTAPRSPWQNARGTRHRLDPREYLDHMIVMNTAGLHRVITECVAHYLRSRTHLALGKDTPITRRVAA